jgi:hypothetical protein
MNQPTTQDQAGLRALGEGSPSFRSGHSLGVLVYHLEKLIEHEEKRGIGEMSAMELDRLSKAKEALGLLIEVYIARVEPL